MEWRHHVHLAEEARMELRAEIESNLKQLKEHQPEVKKCRQTIDTSLIVLALYQVNQGVSKERKDQIGFCSRGVELSDTAWKTAQTTGALAYMPYEEAEEYASIYQAQSKLNAMEEKPVESGAGFLGLMTKFHKHMGEMSLTAGQASDLAEILGQMRMQMALADTQLQNVIEK
ncbi:MAG: hypothetical protein WAN35_14110, partial [Terracidiphilus sp.]